MTPVIIFVGVAVRCLLVARTIVCQGDAAVHACLAYDWSLAPRLIWTRSWLPGFDYLAGAMCWLIPDPVVAPRLFNVLVGSATLPLIHVLTRDLYGTAAARIATLALALCPLHAGLSASSLTEPAFVFFFLATEWLLLRAVDPSVIGYRYYVFLSLVTGVAAELSRYEAWFLIPVLALWTILRSKNTPVALLSTVLWSLFPARWVFENYLTGDGLRAIHNAGRIWKGGEILSFGATCLHLVKILASLMGLPLLALFATGTLLSVSRSLLRGGAAQRLHAAIVCVVWAWGFAVALKRGTTMDPRYLALGIVLSLVPLADWLSRFQPGPLGVMALLTLGGVSLASSKCGLPHYLNVNWEWPVQIERFVSWRDGSPYRSAAVVFGCRDWRFTYAPLFSPDLIRRSCSISEWLEDQSLGEFLRVCRPRIFVAVAGDVENQNRLESMLGARIDPVPVARIGDIEVFDIAALAAGVARRQITH